MAIKTKIKGFVLQEREKNSFLWQFISYLLSCTSSKISRKTQYSGAILRKCEIMGGVQFELVKEVI